MLTAAVAMLGQLRADLAVHFGLQAGQNLSLLNVGSLISLIICVVMTVMAPRNRSWFLLPIVYIFAMIYMAFITLIPKEFITHLEATPGLMGHIGLATFFLCGADYRRYVHFSADVA